LYGPRINLFDIKLAKNIRFGGKRLLIGADIYNIFNSDGITTFNATYTNVNNQWGTPTFIVPPRFVRAQIAFNF
jgi:outer membrane receptor protein involved in Fe transport